MIKDKFMILKPYEGEKPIRKLPIQDVAEMLMVNMNPKDYATALADYFEAKIATAMRVNALIAQMVIDPNDVDEDEYELFKFNLVNVYQEDDKVIVMPMQLFRSYVTEHMIDDQIVIDDKTASVSSTLVNNKINASALHVRVASLRMIGSDQLNYSDIAMKIKDQLGEYASTVQDEIDKYATIISDKASDTITKLKTVTNDIIGDNTEPEITEYDAFAEVNYGNYTGTGTSHVIENMTLGQTVVSGAATAGKVVVGLCKGVWKLLSKVGKYAVKTFDKYVMPAIVSKDFVKGEGTDEYHIDYPMNFSRDASINSTSYTKILNGVKEMITRSTDKVGSADVTSYAKYDGTHVHAGYHLVSDYNEENISCDVKITVGGNFYVEEIGMDDHPKVEGNNYRILNHGYARYLLIGDISSLNTRVGESYYLGPSKEDPSESAIYLFNYDFQNYNYAGVSILGEPCKLAFSLRYPEIHENDIGYHMEQSPQNDSNTSKFQLDEPLVLQFNEKEYKFGTLFTLNDKDNTVIFSPGAYSSKCVILAPMALDLDSIRVPAEVGITLLSAEIPRQSVFVNGSEFTDNWWGPNDNCMLIEFDLTNYYDQWSREDLSTWLNVPVTFAAQFIPYKSPHAPNTNDSIEMIRVTDDEYEININGTCTIGVLNRHEKLVHKIMDPVKHVIKPIEFDDKTVMYELVKKGDSYFTMDSQDAVIPINNWNKVDSNTMWLEGITLNHCYADDYEPLGLITFYMKKFIFGATTVDSDTYQLLEYVPPGERFNPVTEDGYQKYDNYFIIGYIPENCIYHKEYQLLESLYQQWLRSDGVRSVFVKQNGISSSMPNGTELKFYIDCDFTLLTDDDITRDLLHKFSYDLYLTTRGLDADLNDELSEAVQNEYYKVVNNDLPIIFRSQLYSMQYKLKSGKIDCIEFIAPSDPTGFIYEVDGYYQSAFTLNGSKLKFNNPKIKTEEGNTVDYDLTDSLQIALLRDKLLSLFDKCDNNTYVKEFDGETGDVNAYVGIKASLLKMYLIMLCMTGDKTSLYNFLINGSKFTKPENVANGDFINAIKYCSFDSSKQTNRINSFYQSLVPILITSMIYNKQSVLPFVYSATFDYGVFIPYGEQAKLGMAKWHIRDDEEVAQAAAKVWDVIIASVIIVALAVIIGIGIWKFKDKMKFKIAQIQAKERQNALKQNELIRQREELDNDLSLCKARIKELKKKAKTTPLTKEEARDLVWTQGNINGIKRDMANVAKEFQKTWGITKSNNLKTWFITAVSGVSVPAAATVIKDDVKSKITESNENLVKATEDYTNVNLEMNAKLDLILSKL